MIGGKTQIDGKNESKQQKVKPESEWSYSKLFVSVRDKRNNKSGKYFFHIFSKFRISWHKAVRVQRL